MNNQTDYSQVQVPQLVELMKAVLSGNNQLIQEATQFLKGYTKSKYSIRLLAFVLINSEDASIRQLSTVLLRRNIEDLFKTLNIDQQQQFKKVLLIQFQKETSLVVQKGIALLIGYLLPIVELKNWQQLQTLFEETLARVPDSVATLVLLNNLLYHFNPPASIVAYLVKSLSIPSLSQHALRCILAIVETQEQLDINIAQSIITAWQHNKWGEQLGFLCLEIFTAFIEKKTLGQQLITWVIDNLILNTKVSNKLRSCGVDFIYSIFGLRYKIIVNNQVLLKKIVETLCIVSSEPIKHIEDQLQGQSLQDVALWLIETFALDIKQKKKIYPLLFESVLALINSNEVDKMKVGFAVLAAMTEGCSERIRKNLQNPIMNTLIPKGLENTSPQVRSAAINALCYFSEFLIPNIIEFHSMIIPSMMKHINDLSHKVAEKALQALEIFFQNMQEAQIVQYLEVVVPRLVEVLMASSSSTSMKRYSLSAVGSLITASEQKFKPFVEGIYKINVEILKVQPTPELNSIRAQNLTVLGKLAYEFCKQQSTIKQQFFHTYVMPVLEPAYHMLTVETDPEVRQACFSFFYLLANSIKSDFGQIFDKIIVQVIKGCQTEEGQVKSKPAPQISLEESDSDAQEEVNIKTTELDEKAAAIHALGEFAKACPEKFTPYFQRALQILQNHYQYFYQNIRIQSINAYENLTIALVRNKNNGIIPSYKQGLPCFQRYPAQLQNYFNTILIPRLILVMTEQESSEVASVAVEALTNLLKEIGPVLIDSQLDNVVNAIIILLEGKTNFIDSEDEQQEQEEQDDEDTDVNIFETVCDLIPRLCKIIRVGFEPCFKQIYPSMMKYAQQREDINDNVQIFGCLAQCYKYLPGIIALTQQQTIQRTLELMSLNDQELNRNICYCLGIMYENSSKSMEVYLNSGLIALKKIFETSKQLATRENAVAAICRIIYTYNPKMPIGVFIENALTLFPFKEDQAEQRTVLKAYLYLSETNGQALKPYLKAIYTVLQGTLADIKKYKIKEPLLSSLNHFKANLAGLVV